MNTVRINKTVTPRKIEANRKNSERSTGPRTERGKRASRFNALTLGFFTKHVVIPLCDGDKAEKDFQMLLDGLYNEFEPAGFYEEWLVTRIAESMWRLRRATRCESGSVQKSSQMWETRESPDRRENLRLQDVQSDIFALASVEEELRGLGAISQNTFERISPLIDKEQLKKIRPDGSVKPGNLESFLEYVTNLKVSLELMHAAQSRLQDQRSEIRFEYDALPKEADMDRILRYEERMHRLIESAIQRLSERHKTRNAL
jgi:hypothetical protein